jgi:hypothetical protein
MRKLCVSFAFLASTTALACSFQVGTQKPQNPQPQAQAPATPAPAPTPKPAGAAPVIAKLGRVRRLPNGTLTPPVHPGTSPTSPTNPTTPTTGPDTIMTAANAFGTPNVDPNGFAASVYAIPAGATKLPDLNTITPIGTFFGSTINTSSRAMTGGFPGIDANRNENFAIRWEAALVVDNEADYTFRISSDDGSTVKIDGLTIVDNDAHNTLAEKSGPVHLVKGTHALTVDYYQSTGNVAVQLFCKRGTEAETICPTKL